MYWTLELASSLDDAPWPASKEELIDYANRSGAPEEVIENLTETRTVLMDNGAPRRIEFELQLAAVDDERAEPSGGVDPWPTDDGWEWWL